MKKKRKNGKRVYVVEYEYSGHDTVLVRAENESKAIEIAEDNAMEEVGPNSISVELLNNKKEEREAEEQGYIYEE